MGIQCPSCACSYMAELAVIVSRDRKGECLVSRDKNESIATDIHFRLGVFVLPYRYFHIYFLFYHG